MGRVFKFVFRVAVLAAAAFVGYAQFADLPAPERDIVVSLTASEASE